VLLLAALLAIVVFLPAEGRVGLPLHDGITILLGPTAFALPLGLAFVGVLMTVRQVRPSTALPRKRLVGVGLVALGVVAAEHLLGGLSLLGAWLTGSVVETFGAPVAVFLVIATVTLGAWLAFDAHLPQRKKTDAAAS
jgi:hypothetical protein